MQTRRKMSHRWRRLGSNPISLAIVLAFTTCALSAQAQVNDEADAKPKPAEQRATKQLPLSANLPAGQPQQPPDRIQELLKNVDPAMFNLVGAEIEVEVVGNQIILTGPEEAVAAVELLITMLDQDVEQKELRIVTVKQKDANDIARTLGKAVQDALRTPNTRPEDEVSVTALSSNILLVAALPRDMEFVVDAIHQVDEVQDELGKVEMVVFMVKHRMAADVAEKLKEIVTQIRAKQGAGGEKGELQIVPNNANNSIMVLVAESERATIQKLIDEIDVEPVKGWGEVKLTLYPLLHSQADELAGVINELLATQSDREAAEEVISRLSISKAMPDGRMVELPPIDLEKPMRILADAGTNSLIVATVEANVGPMGELIQLMDGVPIAEELGVKLYPLRFADGETLRDTLTTMFDSGKTLPEDPDGSGQGSVPSGVLGEALVYNVMITVDVRTNTLIVAGRQEQLVLVEDIVAQLDRPARALKFPLQFIQLEHTDAVRIGDIITELFDKRLEAAEATGTNRSALERERVFLSVDIRSNSLIVSASEENFEEIVHIAGQLDTKPVKLFDQIRILNCTRVSAADLQEKIESLWERKANLRREEELLEDTPIIVADERSNSLIIASSMEDFEEIKRLVEALEAQPLIDDMRLFKLEYADATVMASMLEELFSGMASSIEGFDAPTIISDPRSNALVVAAARDSMERVEDVVARLDVVAGPMTAIFKVYTLSHASALKLGPRIQELFDSRSEGQEISRTPIVVLADESSNSLVASASRDDHSVIVDLLALLDKPSSLARQFEIFPLKMAKAATVAEKLESLFQSQGDGSQGRADAIAAQADERTNSIIVWASPSEMENIAEVIQRLDTSTPAVEMTMKVIQLKQALAEDFATLLEETIIGEGAGTDDERAIIVSFTEIDERGNERVRKLLRQDITIQADPRTNSLMVMAPSGSIAMLEAMIKDFDKIRPIRSEIRLFPLVNSDAENMVDRLEELFDPEAGDDEVRSQLTFGAGFGDLDMASVGQTLRFSADTRTNTLIAAGAEVDLRMVEELVMWLDSQEAEERVTEVYHARYRDTQDIAAAIQGFNQQEQDVLGEIDDEEAQARRMDRQISVEAIVAEEEQGSSSMIVGVSRAQFQDTMRLIEQLDRPEPQVMIKVHIAEVSLTDSMELGIEIAGQDLTFSKNAVVGPNGVVTGSGYDYVGGTDLGASGQGLGGFNFTVTGQDFSFLLHALQQNSRLEILSRPILLIRNGEEGNVTIADQIPIVESTRLNDTGQTQSTIGREDVGIVLTATPHISPDGYVTIDLVQEISNISGENVQLTEGVSSPVFSTREVTTNVTVRDGETVIIGGLIQNRKSEGESKVPILGDLPWIGALFRATSISESQTELLIALTVDVLRTDEDLHEKSIEERDKYIFSERVRQSPLLGGLRILPETSQLGPVPQDSLPVGGQDSDPTLQRRDKFGPQPRRYGPAISRPTPTSTTAEMPVYGPRIVRSNS